METMSPSSFSVPQETSTYDELSMQQSLLFSDTLKDLKNLRLQLYSAAEYFELSYTHDDQKQMVVNTLKDYAVKALVNTVDHLGSVTYKVNGLLDEQVDEVSGTELRVACIEQRLRMCQEYTDREGLVQQTIAMIPPKYHKRYILPGKVLYESGDAAAKYQDNVDNENNNGLPVIKSGNENDNGLRLIKTAPKTRDTSSSSFRKTNSQSPSPRYGNFFFTEKGAVSPRATSYSLVRSGSLSNRPTTPNSSNTGKRVAPKSASMRLHTDTDGQEEKQHPGKSKRLLKALLSRRKSKKDPMLYSYLDEY